MNEIEPFAVAWLRNLFPGAHVDERSIADLAGRDVPDGRCHFFAGIGGWELALRLAGWPEDRPVWTASCPCQPFSSAGRHAGVRDERHLWPALRGLIAECRPPVVFGEQVASRAGRDWLAGVRADLEALGYAVGAADLPAACVGAPHRRQRLWWVALLGNSSLDRLDGKRIEEHGKESSAYRIQSDRSDPRGRWNRPHEPNCDLGFDCICGANTAWEPYEVWAAPNGAWRRCQPGTLPMVDGVSAGVGRLRAYGNAIVPQVAAAFVRAFMETEQP